VARFTARLYGEPEWIRHTALAFTGEVDGEIVGIGGLSYVGGDVVAFADLTDEARAHPVTLHRFALQVMKEARKRGHRVVFASADKMTPAAARWLAHLGFQKQEDRNLYQWRPL
jgi:N-acetylglutamate synthase-like GNAT family acetyltransferase